MKTLLADMTAHINGELTTLATCWHVTRRDGEELFLTDHDRDIVFGGDTYVAATGIARTSIESSSDMSVDNLDVVGILGGALDRDEMLAGHYDFAEFDIFSVNWVNPDRYGTIQHRFGTIGEIEVKDGSYAGELRGKMQLLERRRGKVWSPDCRANLFSPLVDIFSGRATGCGLSSTPFEEYAEVVSVTNDREFVVNEFSRLAHTPTFPGLVTTGVQVKGIGDIVGVRQTADGYVEMVLDADDSTPMRPTIITNRAGLEAMADNLYGYYVLGNDIDLTSTTWTPIGTAARPFMGTFDGMGYVVRNVTVTTGGTDPAGLFGACGGLIRRVGVEFYSFSAQSATEWAGSICGILYGDDPANYPTAGGGQIEGCWAVGGEVRTNGDYAGGLIGLVQAGTIVRECWTSSFMNGAIGTDAGAIVGRAEGTHDVDRYSAGLFANTDAAGTTTLGNINGVDTGYNGLTEAEWILVASFSGEAAWDFNDREVMNVKGSTAITVDFRDLSVDKIIRASGSFIDDGVRPDDHMTVVGSASNDGVHIIGRVEPTKLWIYAAPLVNEFAQSITYTIAGGPRFLSPGRF